MSGGRFNYDQYRIESIAEEVRRLIETNDVTDTDEWGQQIGMQYDAETIAVFKEALFVLKLAYAYAQRIDWLVSGDDGEENFKSRLKDDIEQLTQIEFKDYLGERNYEII